jgi:hypothetical protein
MNNDIRFDKAPIYKCVICGNEYAAKERDVEWNWKKPVEIEEVEYKGGNQFRCIPELHAELLYSVAKAFEPIPVSDVGSIPPSEPRAPTDPIPE